MKAVKIDDIKINTRQIAESMWGEGGTQRAKTNRRGVSFYSCSSHGGYIATPNSLKATEIENIKKYIEPINLMLLVQHREDGDYVIGTSTRNFARYIRRERGFKYNPCLGKVDWVKLPIYTFEEDCEWCILEKFTDIKVKQSNLDEEKRQKYINNTFLHYFQSKEIIQ